MKTIDNILSYDELKTFTEILSKIAVSTNNVIEYSHSTGKIKFWKPIDEDKLDKLAIKYEKKMFNYCVNLKDEDETDFSEQQNIVDIHEAYKAGYRKAKEE